MRRDESPLGKFALDLSRVGTDPGSYDRGSHGRSGSSQAFEQNLNTFSGGKPEGLVLTDNVLRRVSSFALGSIRGRVWFV
jgi:hypothetical protein